MIVGVGVDLVDVARFRRALETWGERLTRRLFAESELADCRGRSRPAEGLAGRFAAKEAFLKALGTGLAGGLRWREVVVARDAQGRPRLELAG
ncbi:MAG TPA: holo-ACP synthase, partial [Gemmatimonadales bacterium]|nr:holo-ACP synthase [Gemmatimonadales bacterium]